MLLCLASGAHAQTDAVCRAAFPTLVQPAQQSPDFDIPSVIRELNGVGTVESQVVLDGAQLLTLVAAPSVSTRRLFVMAFRYSADATTTVVLRAGGQVIWGPRLVEAGGHEDLGWTLSFPVCAPPGEALTVEQTGSGHVSVVAFEAP